MASKSSGQKTDKTVMSGKKLTQPLALEDGKVPGLLRNLTYIVCSIICAAIVWGSVSEIRELAVGRGEIVPAGSVKSVHHLEGGIIEKVLVQEGQVVEPGTPVLRLHHIVGNSDLKQLKVRQVSLMFQKQRLVALLNNKEFTPTKDARNFPNLAKDQVELFNIQRAVRKREKQTLQTRINQRSAEIDAYDLELESLVRQVSIRGDRMKVAETLYNKKIGTKSSLLELKSEYEETMARSISLNGRRISAREALAEAKSVMLESKIKSRQLLTQELTKASTDLAEIDQNIIKQSDKVERLVVRSPVRGVIQSLPFRTKGEVIKPGEMVAKIVPVEEAVVAEIRLDPKDIGHVKIGDKAEVKISTFDPNVFGVIKGTVNKISASSFQSERGEVYFKAIVKLASNTIGRADKLHKITPGMLLQADIITGSKSLVQYMLKPVYRSLDTAFSER